MSKTWRKERIIKASDVKARDDLDDMRRGGAFADKTKYRRKQKYKPNYKENVECREI